MGHMLTNGLGTNGLAIVLSVLSLLVPLLARGGGGWSKTVANYLYPPLVNNSSDQGRSTPSPHPVFPGESVRTPPALPMVNDSGKNGLKITALPNELLVKILANLAIGDLLACKQVCTNWQTLITTVPALACAAYRSCHPPGSAPRLDDTIDDYHRAIRPWLDSCSEQGHAAVAGLDRMLASAKPHFPEQLFFAIARVLDQAQAFACKKECTVAHSGPVYGTLFSPNEQHLFSCSDGSMHICSFGDGGWQDMGSFFPSAPVLSARFSPDSKHLVVLFRNGNATLWTLADRQWQQQADWSPIFIQSCPIFSADSASLLTVSTNHIAQIYQLVAGQWQPQATAIDNYPVRNACFHPNEDDLLATYYHNAVTFWHPVDGRWQVNGTCLHTFEVANIHFSPDGNRLLTHSKSSNESASEARVVCVWHRVDRAWRQEALLPLPHAASTACFSPCGNCILTAPGQSSMDVWRLSGGSWVKNSKIPRSECFSGGCFGPDERSLATSTQFTGCTIIWTYQEGQLHEQAVIPCIDPLRQISFGPHGNHMVTISGSTTASIWGVVEGRWREKATLAHPGRVYTVGFSPYGGRVVTSTWKGAVRIWTLNSQ